jgi:hypothetical protein
VARVARALCGELIAGTRGGLEFDGSNEGSSFSVPAAGACHRSDGWSPLPNKRMKLAVGPAGTMSARTAVRCRCNSSLSGSASWRPPFGSTSVAVVGGPTAAYAQSR